MQSNIISLLNLFFEALFLKYFFSYHEIIKYKISILKAIKCWINQSTILFPNNKGTLIALIPFMISLQLFIYDF